MRKSGGDSPVLPSNILLTKRVVEAFLSFVMLVKMRECQRHSSPVIDPWTGATDFGSGYGSLSGKGPQAERVPFGMKSPGSGDSVIRFYNSERM